MAKDEEEDEKPMPCEVFDRVTWRDLFPDLYPRRKEVLDDYIYYMLCGIGLESYSFLFQGMNLKTFLQLTEDDICNVGIDITVHKEMFLEGLEQFHRKKWNIGICDNIRKQNHVNLYVLYSFLIF